MKRIVFGEGRGCKESTEVTSLETQQESTPETKRDPFRYIVDTVFADRTPTRLRLCLVSTCLVVLAFYFRAEGAIRSHEFALVTVGKNSAPSVVAANLIKGGLLKMDASLANQLLLKDQDADSLESFNHFETARATACQQLVVASANITYGPSEIKPIEQINLSLGRYQMQAQRTRDLYKLRPGPEVLKAYREGLAILNEELLPAVDQLCKVNGDTLESTFGSESAQSAMRISIVVVLGFVLIAVLGLTQIFLLIRFRRIFNPMLLAATIATLIFLNHLYSELTHSAGKLKRAKEDSYDSIVAVLSAQCSLYEANAAQSRWLLDRNRSAQYEQQFKKHMGSIVMFSGQHDIASSISLAQKQLADDEKLNLPGLTGTLAQEFANVRFEEEGQTALEALQALKEYRDADARMRSFENSGQHESALRIGLGYHPFAAKYSFTKLDDAFNRLIKINQNHFEDQIRDAAKDLAGLQALARLFLLLVTVCAFFGLSPRFAEFRK